MPQVNEVSWIFMSLKFILLFLIFMLFYNFIVILKFNVINSNFNLFYINSLF